MENEASHNLAADIAALIDGGRQDLLAERFRELEAADLADVLEDLDEDQREGLFGLLSTEQAADVLAELEPGVAEDVVEDISTADLADIVEQMAPDDSADIISGLDEERSAEVLAAMEPAERADVTDLLRYEEESAGGIMTPQFCALYGPATVDDARRALACADIDDPVHYIHVIEPRSHKLLGLVSLLQLVTSEPTKRLADLADPEFIYAAPDEDQEDVARKFRKYDLWVMPVLDDQQRLIGRITVDDIMDVVEQEAAEDIALMTGTPDIDEDEDSSFRVAAKRLPWLFITLAAGLVNSVIIKTMLNVTNEAALAIFVPAVLAMGGNTGIQSSTVCIRSVALGSERYNRISGAVSREIAVGLFLGVACGTVTATVAYGVMTLTGVDVGNLPYGRLALTIGLAMCNGMVFAACFGSIVPIVLARFKIDPAVASGPFVTTSNDLSSALIYFATCLLLLKGG